MLDQLITILSPVASDMQLGEAKNLIQKVSKELKDPTTALNSTISDYLSSGYQELEELQSQST